MSTPIGDVPVIATQLVFADRKGTWKVRWGSRFPPDAHFSSALCIRSCIAFIRQEHEISCYFWTRPGVGCAYALLMSQLRGKEIACGD